MARPEAVWSAGDAENDFVRRVCKLVGVLGVEKRGDHPGFA